MSRGGGEGRDRSCGRAGELVKDGGDPCRCSDFVSDHGEDLIVLCFVFLQKLLSKSLTLKTSIDLSLGTCRSLASQLGLDSCFVNCWSGLGNSELLGPDGDELALFSETNRDASRVDEKVELAATKAGNPVEPLDASCEASGIDCTRWEAGRGECEAAAARATKWLFRYPSRGEEGGEVCLKDKLEFDDDGGRVGNDEWASEVSDGVSDSDGNRRCRGGHCERVKMFIENEWN